MDRKERFQRAYNYLKFKGVIKKQDDVAKIMQATRSNVSLALSGNEKVLTDNFIIRFVRAFNMFNLDYLLNGEGFLLVEETGKNKTETHNQKQEKPSNALLDALLDAKDETINALKQQLKAKDEVIEAKEQLIESLRQQLPYSQKECSGYMGVADKQY